MSSVDRLEATVAIMSRLGIAPETFGDINLVGQLGIDFVGRYEVLFCHLRSKLIDQKENLKRLFACEFIASQMSLVQSTAPLGAALDAAFDSVFSLENLIIYFGENATGNRVQEFSTHFTSRIRQYLSSHLASSSAWMFNLLCGSDREIMPFPPQFPWLSLPQIEVSATIAYRPEMMKPVLDSLSEESQHVVHLSNILDWDTREGAAGLLVSANRVLKPKGVVIIRQLNSDLDIPSLGPGFYWELEFGRELETNDRSFFYRNIFVGIKI